MVNILDHLSRSPIGRALLAEEEQRVLDERQAAVAAIAKLEDVKRSVLPPLRKAEAAAIAKVQAAQLALTAAQGLAAKASQAVTAESVRLDAAAIEHRRTLQDLAPQAIKEFVDELLEWERDAMASIQELPPIDPAVLESQPSWGPGWEPTNRNAIIKEAVENHAAKLKYLETLRRMRPEVEALVYTDLGGEDLAARIAAMRKAVVDVEYLG